MILSGVSETALKRTPLFLAHARRHAKFVPFAGWEMPLSYGAGIVTEHHTVRQRVGLFDVTHMGRIEVVGSGAGAALDALVTNALSKLEAGRALYTCCCRSDGGILDDLIVYRRDANHLLVICNASNRQKIFEHLQVRLAAGVEARDVSAATGLLALQGPRALEVLEHAGVSAARALGRMQFASVSINGQLTTVARTGYTGEDGFEIVCDIQALESVYERLMDVGARFDIGPVGLGARDTLRLEARLSLYGHEIDETIHPLEAGLGWTVKLDKGPFLGREALQAWRDRGISRTLVGIEMLGRGVARHGYRVLDSTNRPVGHVTSGGPSPTLGKNIALCYVPVEMATVGERLMVDCRGKQVPAQVVPTPFYKRSGRG